MPREALLRRVWRSLKRRGLDFELAYRCADEGTQGGRPAWMAALQGTVFP